MSTIFLFLNLRGKDFNMKPLSTYVCVCVCVCLYNVTSKYICHIYVIKYNVINIYINYAIYYIQEI